MEEVEDRNTPLGIFRTGYVLGQILAAGIYAVSTPCSRGPPDAHLNLELDITLKEGLLGTHANPGTKDFACSRQV